LAESPRPMSDTKKLASPSVLNHNVTSWPVGVSGSWSLCCDASSAQFRTHYYYLKLAFQQTFSAFVFGPIQKELGVFIAIGSSVLSQRGSREGTRKLELFSAAIVIEARI